jgi:hypothetical protein
VAFRPVTVTGSDGGGGVDGGVDVGVINMVVVDSDDDNAIGHLTGSQGPGTQATGAKGEEKANKTSKKQGG